MLKAFEFTPARRLKLYWEDDEGGSTGEYDQIPTSTILQFPTEFAADLTREMVARGWGIRQGSGGPVWYRVDEPSAIDRHAVALRILCALLTIPEQARALAIEDAFELADRFVAVAGEER